MSKYFYSAGLLFAVSLFCIATMRCTNATDHSEDMPVSKLVEATEALQAEVWHMEELYWQYVQQTDTVSYKKLWHDNFIGYPSFGDGVSNKNGIAKWIPELHKDTTLTFSYTLYQKATNVIDDVVIVFYDADEIWTDKGSNSVIRKETYKFTHTWKKYGDAWLILGGMAALKTQ